jgi:acyl transferase domain-containing protein
MAREDLWSSDGSFKLFDSNNNGFARGEAINAVFIKRLNDALRDKTPIRAIIQSTGTNSDG